MVLACLALWAGSAVGWAQSTLQVVSLRCEARVNPRGIGNPNPELSWQLQNTAAGPASRGLRQSAYEIRVGTTPGGFDLWTSQKVASSQTAAIIYAGQVLPSGQQCFWQVRVYDAKDQASAWSAPGQWTMGLVNVGDWSAQWIGHDAAYNLTPEQTASRALFNTTGLKWMGFPAAQARAGAPALLRKQIILPEGQAITNAVLALYADNYAAAYVNGQSMTNAAMRWEATAQIKAGAWLHAGTNQLAVAATNTDAGQAARVIGRLVVQFASGSVSNIAVDTTWKVAQQAGAGWTQSAFDDSAWATAEANSGTPWGTPALNDITRVPAAYLRKSFSVARPVTNATVSVTALGAYELHLNGQKVSQDVLTPGWTQFTKRVYYQTYDVTGMVQAGSNTLGAILGDGWYASVLAFKGQRLNYGGTPRFIAQLKLAFADGSTQTVTTDGSWKASYGPIQFGDLLIGSGYDARQEMPGWDGPNFNDSGWSPVVTGLATAALGYADVTTLVSTLRTNNQLNFVVNNTTLGGDPAFGTVKTFQIHFQLGGTNQTLSFVEAATVKIGGGGLPLAIVQALYGNAANFPGVGGLQLQAAVTEPARCVGTLAATNLTQPAPGVYIFDLGQNLVGWARLTISGHPGDRITVRHGEMLNPDGSLYTANLRGAGATDFYIFGTNGTVVYEPRFTFHGFRYVEVRGLAAAPTRAAVVGIVVQSDMAQTGTFACSSPLVNQLFSNIIWGQKGNYLEVPTDCPQRDERLGWTGDTEFFVPTAAYNFDVQSFFRRHLVTLCEDAQGAGGAIADVAPDLGVGGGAAAWGDAAWICPYTIYRAYGDTKVVADHYAAMQRWGQFWAAHAANFIVASLPGDFGDWLNLGGGASQTVIDTAFYAYYAQGMAEMSAAIGKSSDAATYSALHSNIVSAFAGFFKADGSFTDGSSQTAYALAFTLNLVPPGLRAAAAQQFANSITQYNNHLATGFIGTPRLLPALHLAGRDDLAYQLLLQRSYPSWLYQVTLGATTMWERWDGWTPGGGFQTVGMNSFNHYAFGAVGEYLYSAVGGISAASPGYQNILIQPVPGAGLTWANTSYDSTRGLIATAWTNSGNIFDLAVTIPPNAVAQVQVPTTNAAGITESGLPVGSAGGVSFLGLSNGVAIYAVGSGSYFFSSPYPAPAPVPVVTEIDAVYAGGSFPPLPTGDLLTNKATTVVANTVTGGPENHLPTTALYDGLIGAPLTTNRSFEVTGGAITFSLGGGALGAGYTITNLLTYTAWQDDGRENANYFVSYSRDGTNFTVIATVAYNPSPYPTKDGTGGTLTTLQATNLTGVRFLRWNFSGNQQNAGVGYTEIAAFGFASGTPPPATILAATTSPTNLVMNVGGLVPGQSYRLESTTNLRAGIWATRTNFSPARAFAALTNARANSPEEYYRVVGN